jgi:hypothetical protein
MLFSAEKVLGAKPYDDGAKTTSIAQRALPALGRQGAFDDGARRTAFMMMVDHL